MKKLDIVLIIFTLLLTVSFSKNVFAEEQTQNEAVLKADNPDTEIEVYENIGDGQPKLSISDNTAVILLDQQKEFTYIRAEIDDSIEEGYVKNKYIVINENEENETVNQEESNEKVNTDRAKEQVETDKDSTAKEPTIKNAKADKVVTGIALQDKTYVYQSKSTSSEKLKYYKKGSSIKYTLISTNWYEATVLINGKWVKGYFNAADVDHSGESSVVLHGYAVKAPTKVYNAVTDESTVANAKVLKTYPVGSKLRYRTYNSKYYIATVYINGQAQTGYILKSDVAKNMPVLQGYAQQVETIIYESTSRNSKEIKSYLAGHLLKYRPYNDNWYKATVYISGKAHTGYIHKSDVGANKPALQGYAQLSVTGVYESTSKDSNMLKSYPAGHLLKYREYNDNWYKATVFISGKAHTGYIHKDDVGANKPVYQGYAQMEATAVYSKTSTTSKVLKSYRAGTLLKYKPYDDTWYEATVYIKGKATTGYIHKDHVGDAMPTLTGFADKKSTAVYSNASSSSQVLKTYKKGHLLKYRPYNNSWYVATVFINGKKHTGYISHNDVVQPVGKTVVIDAGHGGYDPGASANGLSEKDINLELALSTMKSLEKSGFNVIMTRTTDEFLQLKERTDIANNSNAHLFLSIHVNSGGGTGVETYWYTKGPKPSESKEFADNIQSEVIKETGATNRGVKDKNLHINRESTIPSALLEVGFIDHKNDAENLKQKSYKNSIVKGIVNGIKSFFKIPF